MTPQEVAQLVQSQRAFFQTNQTLSLAHRKEALKALRQAIENNEEAIEQALYADLGKGATEAFMSEIGMAYEEIAFMLKHLDELAAIKHVPTPLSQFGSTSEIVPIPYGQVLIVSPWNYPFNLTMVPLVDALAAGNTAVVKPSAYSPHTSAIIEKVLLEAFDPLYVTTIQGGRQENQALFGGDFDYIFFTGSVAVGREVMSEAAKKPIPVTLELGGKSPCIVDETANLALAARRIVFGKFLNAGQTCVAPDYVLVQASVHDALISQLKHQISLQYPTLASIGKIINEKHYHRLLGLLDPAKTVVGGRGDESELKIAPTILDHVSMADPVMGQEIFGPILPVLTYTDYKDLMKKITNLPTPLACYLFSRDEKHIYWYKKALPFGSGCINDTVVQLATPYMPFGGLGNSGLGQYHGKYGFATFSHDKSILTNDFFLDLPFKYAPYSKLAGRLIRGLLRK